MSSTRATTELTKDSSRTSVSQPRRSGSFFLYRFSLLTAAAGFILVMAGGLVTSTDSGLAVPDWPLSYGSLFPPMVGGIRFEHSHRVIAATVGLLTLTQTLCILFLERRRTIRWLALVSFALVVFQGILGGLTVLLQLPHEISIAHACLGQAFFATLVILATALSPAWLSERMVLQPSKEGRKLAKMAVLTTAAVYLQLILGAALRHVGWLPDLIGAHAAGAFAAAACILWTAGTTLRQYRRNRLLQGTARLLPWLLMAQIILGITTFAQGAAVGAATAHVAVGALLLAACAVLATSVYRFIVRPLQPTLMTGRPLRAYLELTKPRLTFLAVLTSLLGFFFAAPLASFNAHLLLAVFFGTALVGGGSGALNQWMEREADGRMDRTKHRPLPSGLLSPRSALVFGIGLSIAGFLILSLGANPLAGGLAALTAGSYLFIYTPMKSVSPLCTLAGAVPGAIPPLIGWAAVRNSFGIEAWILFSILFLWQLPHFLAIAWAYREDYAKADFKMLPIVDPDGDLTSRQIVLYLLALIPVSLMPAAFGLAGWLYFLTALISGLTFLGFGLAIAWTRSNVSARRLFLASIMYLPVILITMTLDKVI